jgi:high-affinity iron transporter
MFSMLMVSFREGLEALLIVSITLTYLRATNRRDLIRSAQVGLLFAVALSAALGVVLSKIGAQSPLVEGWLALLAAICVISCTVHMLRHGKQMAAQIRNNVDAADTKSNSGRVLAVFGFVALMVGREGVEAATMIASLARAGDMQHLLFGAVIGLTLAALVAAAWARLGSRINLSLFFQLTTVFMVLFSLQLVVYAFHEFSEVGALPLLDNAYWHVASEPFGPEGQYGAWLSYSLILVPIAFLLRAALANNLRLGLGANKALPQ